jgi:anti-sigma factor RsiW
MTAMSRIQPEAHTLTAAYVCDALDPAERTAFEGHLEVCPACRQEVAELREVAALLGMGAAETPPERLKEAVHNRIAVTRQIPPRVAPIGIGGIGGMGIGLKAAARGPRRQRPRRARAGWIVAAALAGVVAGQAVYSVQQQDRIDSVSRQATAMASLLSAPDAHSNSGAVRTGGTALVVDSRSRDEAAIALTGLATLPQGKAYQLWMIGPDGARSGGVVTLANGSSGPIIAKGLDDAKSIGITIEPAKGSAQPTTSPILILPMA